ncbi:MAG: hypothetical protein L0Y60_11400 [Beijerinckiaceae bacterium]|nr:hypothetical protein [Beijerinckiaceae bacterium]
MQVHNGLEQLIGKIVAGPALHARWLNTFSYLEYIGFRKIVKSQRAETMSAAILGHACEEGRHALGLKKLAIKLGGAGFDTYLPDALLCGEEAKEYFQTLDRSCDEAFASLRENERVTLTYCYVTWLVERRALDVYRTYKLALGESEIARKLTSLLAEETKHLADVEALLQSSDPEFFVRSKTFATKEAALYQNFIEALASELANHSAASEAVSG